MGGEPTERSSVARPVERTTDVRRLAEACDEGFTGTERPVPQELGNSRVAEQPPVAGLGSGLSPPAFDGLHSGPSVDIKGRGLVDPRAGNETVGASRSTAEARAAPARGVDQPPRTQAGNDPAA